MPLTEYRGWHRTDDKGQFLVLEQRLNNLGFQLFKCCLPDLSVPSDYFSLGIRLN